MDSRDWQELMQQLLLEIQKTNQEQLQILGELKACVNSIKKRQDKHEERLDEHDHEIATLKDVQAKHKTYFRLLGAAISLIVTALAALSQLREFFTR